MQDHPRAARLTLALCLLAGLAPLPGRAADTSPPPAPAAAPKDKLADARKLIAAKQWPAAIEALKKVNDSGSADWNNLMGYTACASSATPDLAAGSEKFYNEALRIDPQAPRHARILRRALPDEGRPGRRPRQRLAALDKACTLPLATEAARP